VGFHTRVTSGAAIPGRGSAPNLNVIRPTGSAGEPIVITGVSRNASGGIIIDEAALREASKLDGCYVITTDLDAGCADMQTVHDRYKDLARVEWAFRTSKTAMLEMRPIHVRKEKRTRGHALVVMLAFRNRSQHVGGQSIHLGVAVSAIMLCIELLGCLARELHGDRQQETGESE